jgi:NitT/TauT family transport system substrate-binding protein
MRRIVLLTLLTIILVSPPAQGAGPFNIAFDDWIGFAPFFLAAEKDFYHGVEVRINRITKEDERREGLVSGRFQMICETMGMFQTNRKAPDYAGKLIFALAESRGADGVLAANGIKSVGDLKGRTVVGQVGIPSHLLLTASLAREGMSISDLNFLNISMPEAVTAFLHEKADALCAYEPHLSSSLKARSGAHLLLSSRDFPGLIVDVSIVKEDVISARREDLENIYEGWTMAVAFIRENPAESARLIAKALGIQADEFRQMSTGFMFFGKAENEKYFGVKTPCCESDALLTFNLIGKALEKYGLTTAVSPGGERIDFSIIGTVRLKRNSPMPEKLP